MSLSEKLRSGTILGSRKRVALLWAFNLSMWTFTGYNIHRTSERRAEFYEEMRSRNTAIEEASGAALIDRFVPTVKDEGVYRDDRGTLVVTYSYDVPQGALRLQSSVALGPVDADMSARIDSLLAQVHDAANVRFEQAQPGSTPYAIIALADLSADVLGDVSRPGVTPRLMRLNRSHMRGELESDVLPANTILHEAGHLLGLTDTSDDLSRLVRTRQRMPILPDSSNNGANSIMSYAPAPLPQGRVHPIGYQALDIAALQTLFGPPPHPVSVRHDLDDVSYPRTYLGSPGHDVLVGSGTADKFIDLRGGGNRPSIGESLAWISEPFEGAETHGDGLHVQIGNARANTLQDGPGDTAFMPGQGDDTLRTGDGQDIVRIRAGDGTDRIADFDPERDVVEYDPTAIGAYTLHPQSGGMRVDFHGIAGDGVVMRMLLAGVGPDAAVTLVPVVWRTPDVFRRRSEIAIRWPGEDRTADWADASQVSLTYPSSVARIDWSSHDGYSVASFYGDDAELLNTVRIRGHVDPRIVEYMPVERTDWSAAAMQSPDWQPWRPVPVTDPGSEFLQHEISGTRVTASQGVFIADGIRLSMDAHGNEFIDAAGSSAHGFVPLYDETRTRLGNAPHAAVGVLGGGAAIDAGTGSRIYYLGRNARGALNRFDTATDTLRVLGRDAPEIVALPGGGVVLSWGGADGPTDFTIRNLRGAPEDMRFEDMRHEPVRPTVRAWDGLSRDEQSHWLGVAEAAGLRLARLDAHGSGRIEPRTAYMQASREEPMEPAPTLPQEERMPHSAAAFWALRGKGGDLKADGSRWSDRVEGGGPPRQRT